MGVVKLKILKPPHGSDFTKREAVTLQGEVLTTGHGKLFFKWYSNLGAVSPAQPAPTQDNPDASLNRGETDKLTFEPILAVGTHVITLAARDVAGEAPAQLAQVKHSGMAGGPPLPGAPPDAAPCVVNVLFAEIVEPAADGAPLSINAQAPKLAARVPSLWEDKEYQTNVNQLRYRWRFVPLGLPAGRPEAELKVEPVFKPHPALPHKLKLQPPFEFVEDGSLMRYRGPLPPELKTGSYTLILRVEKKGAAAVGGEASRRVVLNP